jgi:predicted RNA binding protein YcfA (HicA-like mRNA interferase family)
VLFLAGGAIVYTESVGIGVEVMPKKIRELKAALRKAGFSSKPAKGSHEKWKHEQLSQKIIIAGKDGSDAKPYLEEQVREALEQLEKINNDRSQEDKS